MGHAAKAGLVPFLSLSLPHHTIIPWSHSILPVQVLPAFFQILSFRPIAALLGELIYLSWFIFYTGITPSSSSRTRTPASINATPANINLAGQCRPFLVGIGMRTPSPGSALSNVMGLSCRPDPCSERSTAEHDLPDVQCHRCRDRPGAEPKCHPCAVGIQSVRLWRQWRRQQRVPRRCHLSF